MAFDKRDIFGTLDDDVRIGKIEDEGTYGVYGQLKLRRGKGKPSGRGSYSLLGGKIRQGEKEGEENGYVYYIQGYTNKLIKIGWTNSLKRRLESLQVGSADKIYYIGTLFFNKTDQAKEVEKCLHIIFDEYRLHGEWFSPNPDLLTFIKKFIKDSDEFRAEVKTRLCAVQTRKLDADLEHLYSNEQDKAFGRKALLESRWVPKEL